MQLYARRNEIVDHIREIGGRFFSVRFVKRSNGNIRLMVCRTGVRKHLVKNPKRKGVNFTKNNLIGVFDIQKNKYRCIPIEGITGIKVDGKWVSALPDANFKASELRKCG